MFNGLFKRKEIEEENRKAGRLPPGQSLTQKFPVLHYGPVPNFNPATWDFRIWGEVEEDKSWTWERIQRITPHHAYDGYSLRDQLEQVGYNMGRRVSANSA